MMLTRPARSAWSDRPTTAHPANASRMDAGRIVAYAVLAVAVVAYAGTGRLITSRLPGDVIGWLLSLIGLSLAGAMLTLTEQYALYGVATAPGVGAGGPAGRVGLWRVRHAGGHATLLTGN